ncbi:hypothetical protein [Tessaracoccus sp. OH4464_COT-324]|uniref:hypothetical protein n=1 Tax=Tessaracoccus sp. OH4464_COT-324 TaxID=2491059 RepID=UPI000F63E420|nr:hypothetical protein [Tessaracoccus sp. OH4464_COT-324]RRD47749.1 hypothetical protein EII42_00395 [Tessaracoccus sp. OH4464_COT-324]
MTLSRRALLLSPVALVGCAGSPVVVPGSTPPSDPPRFEDRPGHRELAAAATVLAGLRRHIAEASDSPWRKSSLMWCDERLARLNSFDPFAESAEPEPLPPAHGPTVEPAAAADELGTLGTKAEPPFRLLLLSCAVAARGLTNVESVPATGGIPTRASRLTGQRAVALTHVWALDYGLNAALGRLSREDPLVEVLRARQLQLHSLRELLRTELPSPSQPASLDLPPMNTVEEIRSAWQLLETNLLHALTLLSAEATEPYLAQAWASVEHLHASGATMPSWPGMPG